MAKKTIFKVRNLTEDDFKRWQKLFRGYRRFYQQDDNYEIELRSWQWLIDNDEPVEGIVCETDNHELIGFMHFEQHISTLSGVKVGFLNDLFIQPEWRGQGVFDLLFKYLISIGKENQWPYIQWRTAENNYRARKAYDVISSPTGFVTYKLIVK